MAKMNFQTFSSFRVEANGLVRRGVALLDRKVPNWRQLVDVSSLKMGDEQNNLLAQILRKGFPELAREEDGEQFPSYRDRARREVLGLRYLEDEKYGFALSDRVGLLSYFEILTEAWKHYI